jgi:hypothetical protein
MKPIHVVIGLLFISVAANVYLAAQIRGRVPIDYREKYKDLRSRYISLAQSQKNLMEVVMKKTDLKDEMARAFPDSYTNLTDEAFREAVRRKIVRLEIEVKDLERNKFLVIYLRLRSRLPGSDKARVTTPNAFATSFEARCNHATG